MPRVCQQNLSFMVSFAEFVKSTHYMFANFTSIFRLVKRTKKYEQTEHEQTEHEQTEHEQTEHEQTEHEQTEHEQTEHA